MGVMQCDRDGCENILCERYSSEYGYICESCFSELKEFTSGQCENYSIREFMETQKSSNNSHNDDAGLDCIFRLIE